MTTTINPEERLDGTIWSGTFATLRRNREVRFFHCDPRRIEQPSHVWYDGIAFELDRGIFNRPPETTFKSDEFISHEFGTFAVRQSLPWSVTLEDLEQLELDAKAEAAA